MVNSCNGRKGQFVHNRQYCILCTFLPLHLLTTFCSGCGIFSFPRNTYFSKWRWTCFASSSSSWSNVYVPMKKDMARKRGTYAPAQNRTCADTNHSPPQLHRCPLLIYIHSRRYLRECVQCFLGEGAAASVSISTESVLSLTLMGECFRAASGTG